MGFNTDDIQHSDEENKTLQQEISHSPHSDQVCKKMTKINQFNHISVLCFLNSFQVKEAPSETDSGNPSPQDEKSKLKSSDSTDTKGSTNASKNENKVEADRVENKEVSVTLTIEINKQT